MATEPEIKQKLLEVCYLFGPLDPETRRHTLLLCRLDPFLQEYKLRNSQKRCTNFNYLQPDASCKFGSSCHFAHVDPDGVPVQVMPRMYMTDEQEVR